jgi:carbon storage regulator
MGFLPEDGLYALRAEAFFVWVTKWRGGMMQILIRHLGETLCIDDDVEITVLAIRGDEVRLGVDAPKSVQVGRKERIDNTE